MQASSDEAAAAPRPQLAREITLLDPACGTMHFGLVAFDLLAAMYAEEIERAGEDGWPATASVANADEIAAAILRHNIWGIDIDLRAVQLSALTLFLRAKTLNPRAVLNSSNLACADVLLLNGERIAAFLREMNFTQPVYERLIRAVWSELKEAGHFGSLLRPQQRIEQLIAGERRGLEQGNLLAQDEFAGQEAPDWWEVLDEQIVQAFDAFARAHRDDSKYLSGIFTGDAIAGMKLLEVMRHKYDVVVTNPPYMSVRKMNARLKTFLSTDYPAGKGDLYAAFIQRCLDFTTQGGRVGMLTMHSFMFITSYETLRKNIAERTAIETMLHLGPALFAVGNPGTLQTVAFVLRREDSALRRDENEGTFFRLVRENDSHAKRRALERALQVLAAGETAPNVFRYRQSDFNAIPGSPWVYWITPELRKLFTDLPKLGDGTAVCMGMRTGGNFRFLRYWWEVGTQQIGFDFSNAEDAEKSGRTWLPYMKGGEFQRWWGNQDYVVEWRNNGAIIKQNTQHNYPELGDNLGWKISNEEQYFRRGIGLPHVASGNLSAWISPQGFIFDTASITAFPTDVNSLLAIGNAKIGQYFLRLINPTVNIQTSDFKRLPIPRTTSSTLNELVEGAIELARQEGREDETTWEFVAPPWTQSLDHTGKYLQTRQQQLRDLEARIDEKVFALYKIAPADREAIERELAAPIALDDEAAPAPDDADSDSSPNDAAPDDSSAANARTALAKRWISYAVGVALGRFDLDAADRAAWVDDDGLASLHAGGPDDLIPRLETILHARLGDAGALQVLAAACGDVGQDALRRYLERDFWGEHLRRYRKRPIFWLWQSPRKTLSFLVFHERITPDTLHLLRGSKYLGASITALQREINAGRTRASALEGRERRELERAVETLESRLLDAEAFEQVLARAVSQTDENGHIVGWRPERDDGVLLNLAPLHELLPSWSGRTSEVKKAWAALGNGDFDWSHTARRYWPNRVAQACAQNKSFALAHGVNEVKAPGQTV